MLQICFKYFIPNYLDRQLMSSLDCVMLVVHLTFIHTVETTHSLMMKWLSRLVGMKKMQRCRIHSANNYLWLLVSFLTS